MFTTADEANKTSIEDDFDKTPEPTRSSRSRQPNETDVVWASIQPVLRTVSDLDIFAIYRPVFDKMQSFLSPGYCYSHTQ